jgi:hypothetical protein
MRVVLSRAQYIMHSVTYLYSVQKGRTKIPRAWVYWAGTLEIAAVASGCRVLAGNDGVARILREGAHLACGTGIGALPFR